MSVPITTIAHHIYTEFSFLLHHLGIPLEDIQFAFLELHFIHCVRLYHRHAVWETELRALDVEREQSLVFVGKWLSLKSAI